MKGIRRLMIILLLLSTMAALTCSQTPVKLNVSEGTALLQSLTKGPLQLNNTSLNATNSSTNMTTGSNTSSNFMAMGLQAQRSATACDPVRRRFSQWYTIDTGTQSLSDKSFEKFEFSASGIISRIHFVLYLVRGLGL